MIPCTSATLTLRPCGSTSTSWRTTSPTLQQRCDRLGIDLRVHTKTHKTPEIARMQIGAGAKGICCQKLGEAEVMVDGGLEDVFILYNIIGPSKLERLTRLIRRDRAAIAVAADSAAVAEGLSRQAARDGCTIRTIVEMDTGLGRCGTQSPRETLELARLIDGLPGLEFGGVMLYPSKEEARPFLDEVRDLTSRAGLPLAVVSGRRHRRRGGLQVPGMHRSPHRLLRLRGHDPHTRTR